MYSYLIFYEYRSSWGESGKGNIDVWVDDKIEVIGQVRQIEKELKDKFLWNDVVMSNFIMLKSAD